MTRLSDKWNERYQGAEIANARPARVLVENLHLLPEGGTALDVACGLGANALQLARSGLNTTAWDISEVAIKTLQAHANSLNLPIKAEVRDIEAYPPESNGYDVIVVSYFLERRLVPHLIQALKPHGRLFYQTFIQDGVSDIGPTNPNFRLKANELLKLFSTLKVLVYREEGKVGHIRTGFRDEAMYVVIKE